MPTYYETLKLETTATVAEIEAALHVQQDRCLRLVTHHDPKVVVKANQALRRLDQIRATLTDPQRREAYDACIGLGNVVGGLADPQHRETYDACIGLGGLVGGLADPQVRPQVSMPTPPLPRAAPQAQAAPSAMRRVDAWICQKCHTANAVETPWCKKCGHRLGVECARCGAVMEMGAEFCPACGMNVSEAVRQKQIERAERIDREREAGRRLAEERARLDSPWAKRLGFGPRGSAIISVIVGAFLGLLTNSLILSASPQVSDLEAVASTALGMAPVMGLIFGAILGALAFHMSDQKAFSASEFGRDVVIGAIGGLVQTLLLLVIGYIAMDGFFLTIIYIVTVIPVILALIAMFTLVATSVLAGFAWGLGFGLVRLTLWQIALQKAG